MAVDNTLYILPSVILGLRCCGILLAGVGGGVGYWLWQRNKKQAESNAVPPPMA